ncbi:alpha-ketoglutarate-dependent dioxygenase AlkB family protein [Kocuria carniphila]|uniref:alpha-ketoglutarate-dependent dioxygenase AlkB family protein n=1 Tax=Kocuria carniphila TaxID=262208 RepID=UPI0034DB4311
MTRFEVNELFSVPRERQEPAPGAVHLPDWLDTERQAQLVTQCRVWVRDSPMRHQVMPGGGRMSVQSVMLGRNWRPYRYGASAGPGIQELPDWLVHMGQRAAADAYGELSELALNFEPDSALINYYDSQAHMGMHQDKDEYSAAPIVSLSLGDTCVFRFGNTETRTAPYQDIELRSGDLFVFGGPSRYAFHGVPKVYPGTGGPQLGMKHGGRLNITLRMTGDGTSGGFGLEKRGG